MIRSRWIFLFVTIALVPFAVRADGDDAKNYRRYGIETLRVQYKISGIQHGTEELRFDRWGMREAKLTDIDVMGFKTRTLAIIDGKTTYTIDVSKNTGTQIETPILDEMAKKAGGNDLTIASKMQLEAMGGKIIGQETILGRTCDVWQLETLRSTAWVWRWVTLKTVMNLAGQEIVFEATEIDESPGLSDTDFSLPEGVTLSEGGNLDNLLRSLEEHQRN